MRARAGSAAAREREAGVVGDGEAAGGAGGEELPGGGAGKEEGTGLRWEQGRRWRVREEQRVATAEGIGVGAGRTRLLAARCVWEGGTASRACCS